MFQKISSRLVYPPWVAQCPRYRRLDVLDKLLDGKFYDHLPNAFYDEATPQGTYIKLEDRRPSAQYRLPTMVANYTSRKLFAGNHAPRVRHKDEAVRKKIRGILKKAKFLPTMLEAAKLGSVGSVAVTFRVKIEGGKTHIGMNCWRSKYCEPSFDDMGELSALRLQYVTSGSWLKAIGAPAPRADEPLDPGKMYWFIRDYGSESEITYNPIQKDDWNPVQGFVSDKMRQMIIWTDIQHGLGFVPGQWFRNLVGGEEPDGACTFEPGIPNSIEMDYTLSQLGRGIRYGAAPTLMIKGGMISVDNDGREQARSPTIIINLPADIEDPDGQKVTGSDAKLLEMNGAGTEAALKVIDKLQDLALESISAARKDPDKVKGPMSGRAMEFIDQEFYDLVMEMREQYGDHGAVQLARKLVQAVDSTTDLSSFSLGWPRLFQPTPTDIAQIIPALAIAIDPLKAGPATPAEPGGTDANGGAKPGKPATTGPDPAYALIDIVKARAWLDENMDLHLLGDDDADPDEPEEETPGLAPEQTPAPEDISKPGPATEGGIPVPTDESIDV